MKKTNFQFYATYDEILDFLNEAVAAGDIHLYLVGLFPEYVMQEMKPDHPYALRQYTFAIFSECRREISSREEYLAYTKSSHGDLILYIGNDTETELTESTIGAADENSVNPAWLKWIAILKKRCMKGAYVVTPQNIRKYYPQIRYSAGARQAWQQGKTIRPAAGWNRVELISEINFGRRSSFGMKILPFG